MDGHACFGGIQYCTLNPTGSTSEFCFLPFFVWEKLFQVIFLNTTVNAEYFFFCIMFIINCIVNAVCQLTCVTRPKPKPAPLWKFYTAGTSKLCQKFFAVGLYIFTCWHASCQYELLLISFLDKQTETH